MVPVYHKKITHLKSFFSNDFRTRIWSFSKSRGSYQTIRFVYCIAANDAVWLFQHMLWNMDPRRNKKTRRTYWNLVKFNFYQTRYIVGMKRLFTKFVRFRTVFMAYMDDEYIHTRINYRQIPFVWTFGSHQLYVSDRKSVFYWRQRV